MDEKELLSLASLRQELLHITQQLMAEDIRRNEGDLSACTGAVYEARLQRRKHIEDLFKEVYLQLDCLPSTERQLIELRYIEGCGWSFVAHALGFSEDHVRGKLRKRALKFLKIKV